MWGSGFGEFSFLERLKRKFRFAFYISKLTLSKLRYLAAFFSPGEGRGGPRKVPDVREGVGGNLKFTKSSILNIFKSHTFVELLMYPRHLSRGFGLSICHYYSWLGDR